MTKFQIAVVLPCYNEALTIGTVIRSMREALPEARIVCFDNNSTDGSVELARAAGAEVRLVRFQGKGNVLRRMFADLDADVYLMVDADMTYDPANAQQLIDAVLHMSVGVRQGEEDAFPPGHKFGNSLFNLIVRSLFSRGMEDIFSGYRAFSRRFAKSFPAHSNGFEIETELSIFTLEQRIPFIEIPVPYSVRPVGSVSKLRTYHDSIRILLTIVLLYKELRPMMFFGFLALILAAASLALGIPVIVEFMHTGLVARLPTAVLSSALGLLSAFMLIAGMILTSVARAYRETRHLAYLNQSR